MRNSLIGLLCAAMFMCPFSISAQNGDEQGFDIPDNLQLPQDKGRFGKCVERMVE